MGNGRNLTARPGAPQGSPALEGFEMVKCNRCGEEMPRGEWEDHALKCAPAPLPGESWEEYKKRTDEEDGR